MHTSNLATFDFNLLRTLHVLLRERNVTRAARELNITQQAVSGSLKRLRHHFGDPLLVRVGQHLEMTPMAMVLVTPVREAIRQIALALDAAPDFIPGATRRHFRMAMSDHASHIVLPGLVADLARSAPGLTYELVPIRRQAVYDLDLGDLDFLVMPQEHTDKLYMSRHIASAQLFEDHFVCVVDEGNQTVGEALSAEDYAIMQHVALKTDDGSRSLVGDSWMAAGLSPRVIMETGSFTDMICLVQGTRLVATVHRRLAEKYRRMLPIRILDYPLPRLSTRQQLNWHARNDTDPAHRFVRNAFLAAGRRVCTQAAGPTPK